VPDQLLPTGCSISDTIAQMADTARNHGQFVSRVSRFTTDLRKDGLISNKDRSNVVRCAAWANVP
jgi:hypothetical protein